MDGPQIRLKLVLDRLGVSPDVSTLKNRIQIQKVIFLAKNAGLDLGYSYNWYVHGPYSPELTTDYFEMNNRLLSGDSDFKKYELISSLTPSLEKTKNIIKIPKGVTLSKTRWLELISSVIFWMSSTHNETQTKQILKKEKPELCKNTKNLNIAIRVLKENNFL
jgi:uncharacterized protein YwgA